MARRPEQFAVTRGRCELRENETGLSAKEGKLMKTMFKCIFHGSFGPVIIDIKNRALCPNTVFVDFTRTNWLRRNHLMWL